jgi:Large ribosomal RNA subunit accumulation protein YceD
MSRSDRNTPAQGPAKTPPAKPVPKPVQAKIWSYPIKRADIPETGRHFDLVADAGTRAAIARLAGVPAMSRLEAELEVTLHGRGGLQVTGAVTATVEQTCVVTLEPIENEIDEPIDLVFVPAGSTAAPPLEADERGEIEIPVDDQPEVLIDDTVDLGVIATEFVMLGIDPYPRKPGAVFEQPTADGDDDQGRPFAALAALEREKPRKDKG